MGDRTRHPFGTIAVPHGEGNRYSEFWIALAQVTAPEGTLKALKPGGNVAANLNDIVRHMVGDWIWLIGDDHTFEPDVIWRLLEHDVDIVAPLCLRRKPPFQTVISTAPEGETGRQILPLKACRGLMPVHAVGTAGMLVRRRVFETMADPWFELGQIRSWEFGEDIHFCEKARKAGFEIYVDSDTVIEHMDAFRIKPSNEGGRWMLRFGLPNGLSIALDPDEVERACEQLGVAEFDEWRARYATMTDDEQRAFYAACARQYPTQAHGDLAGIQAFTAGATSVVEVGGWTGTHAAACLAADPTIGAWTNIEWTKAAAERAETTDPGYRVVVPERFRWWPLASAPAPGSRVVLSHVIEHLSADDLHGLLTWLAETADAFYIEAPLPEIGVADWSGYLGTHMYAGAWNDIDVLMTALGFQRESRTVVGQDRYPIAATIYRRTA